LLFSEQEIEQLEGIKLTREQGTKSNFLKYKDEVSVIHLATHAIVNNEDPSRSFIAFFPDKAEENNYKLFAHELYNTTMSQTQLAFLSACETAQGKLVSGEGIMSLSRAFAYAGCPNMITSLWKAEDHTTAFISQRFYHHLKNGLEFSKALRQAKIDLLQSPQYAQFHSPSYWSHLVFVGSPSAHSNTQPAWVYVLVLLALVGFLAYKGRRILKRSVLKNEVSK
ncbi:MAG: CHAT domain-containing protein, partial [Cytophagales bacterium]|nr:CHAT domain-containing protein [Cytophagales bacterium]